MSFTRALEVSETINDSMRQQQQASADASSSHATAPQSLGVASSSVTENGGDRRDSVYDFHEISV